MFKKNIVLTLVFVLILNFTTFTVEASTHDQVEALRALGLFKGTEKGFELERSPSRAEAAVMLIRLLGLENKVLSGEYNHPFNDVPLWADLYIGYMYEHKLTHGISVTEFGSNQLASANAYATFILRALGYDDEKGDFNWSDSLNKARELNIIDEQVLNRLQHAPFLRGDMVNMSYHALFVKLKDSEMTLLNKLMQAQAVNIEFANALLSKDNSKPLIEGDIKLGTSLDMIKRQLGEPKRITKSMYGFDWYTFHNAFKEFAMLGIRDNKLVAIYLKTPELFKWINIKHGETYQSAIKKYPKLQDSITKDHTIYDYKDESISLVKTDSMYMRLFLDQHEDNSIAAVFITSIKEELNLKGYFGQSNATLEADFEQQLFDIVNAERAMRNLTPYKWHDNLSVVAKKHSRDMIERNFFNHVNPSGEKPSDRIIKDGIYYMSIVENIACGQQNPIFAHEGLMNSKGHRKAILGDQIYMGVGVDFGGTYHRYYTELFLTPQ